MKDKEWDNLVRDIARKSGGIDEIDSCYNPDMHGELGAITEHEQCYGKMHENKVEEDLDDWLEGQIK